MYKVGDRVQTFNGRKGVVIKEGPNIEKLYTAIVRFDDTDIGIMKFEHLLNKERPNVKNSS